MTIELAIQCYFYQIRFCWMLSSIVQQINNNINLTITCSYLKDKQDGVPCNIDVIDFFRNKGLNIIGYEYPMAKMLNRSYFRNDRAKNTKADWIIFADSDMLYDPNFFNDLETQLQLSKYQNETRVMGSDRISLHKSESENFLKSYLSYSNPFYVDNVVEKIQHISIINIGGGRVAPGYFQLINGDAIRKLGKYSNKHNGFNADVSVRKLMGGNTKINLKPQYHLNHFRNNRYAGKNIQPQR